METFEDIGGGDDLAPAVAGALEAGDNLDARIVLLTLHAGVIQSDVVERFDLRSG